MQALWHSGGDLVTNHHFDDLNDDECNCPYADGLFNDYQCVCMVTIIVIMRMYAGG